MGAMLKHRVNPQFIAADHSARRMKSGGAELEQGGKFSTSNVAKGSNR
jgi:hypothetical protein